MLVSDCLRAYEALNRNKTGKLTILCTAYCVAIMRGRLSLSFAAAFHSIPFYSGALLQQDTSFRLSLLVSCSINSILLVTTIYCAVVTVNSL